MKKVVTHAKRITRISLAAVVLCGLLFSNPGASASLASIIVGQASPVLIGINTVSYITENSVNSEIKSLDTWAGKPSALVEISLDLDDANIAHNLPAQLDALWANGITPLVYITGGSGSPSASAIASGKYDTQIQHWADAYKAWAVNGKFAFLAILPEMNYQWVSYYGDPGNYQLAFRRVVDIFTTAGVSRSSVRWIFLFNGWYVNQYISLTSYESYYPGDEYVDVVAFSAYNFGYCAPNTNWVTPENLIGRNIHRIHLMAPQKPIFIASLATSAFSSAGVENADAKNAWLQNAFQFIATQPSIRAVLYRNVNAAGWGECDWQVYQPGGTQYQGYASGVSHTAYGYLPPTVLAQTDLLPPTRITHLPLINNRYQTRTALPLMLGVYGDISQGWWGDQAFIEQQALALNAWGGKKISLAGTFIEIEVTTPWYNIPQQLNMMWDNGMIPFINMPTNATAAEVASGRLDAEITAWATAYKDYALNGNRVAYIAPLEEMDGDWIPYGMDPTNFKLAFKRIQDKFNEVGVPRDSVYWVFSATGYNHPNGARFEDYFPGYDRVDAVGFSALNFGYCPMPRNQWPKWISSAEVLMGEYIQRMKVMAPGKPIFIAQFATSSDAAQGVLSPEAKNSFLVDTYNYLSRTPEIKGILYFNYDIAYECDWAIYKTWGTNQRQLSGYVSGITNSSIRYLWPTDVREIMTNLITLLR